MVSQKEILGRYLYEWFRGNDASDPPKGIRRDYNPDLLMRTPTYWSNIQYWSNIRSLSLDQVMSRQMEVRLTIIAVIGCLEQQIQPPDTRSLTENFYEIAWEALVEGDNKKNLSPLLQLLGGSTPKTGIYPDL